MPKKKPAETGAAATVEEGALDWDAVFSVRQPVEVEVGCGKGRFLLAAAARNPDRNYFGIERRPSLLRLCAARAVKRGLSNVRVMRADALVVLWAHVPAASVSRVHVYYPDPWWKARHKKRRVFNEHFVADVARILEPSGELLVATDVGDYFETIVETVAGSGLFERLDPPEGLFGTTERPITSYQAKYAPERRTIHGALFRRRPRAVPDTPDPRVRLKLARARHREEKARQAAAGRD